MISFLFFSFSLFIFFRFTFQRLCNNGELIFYEIVEVDNEKIILFPFSMTTESKGAILLEKSRNRFDRKYIRKRAYVHTNTPHVHIYTYMRVHI
jgi:uncharacterized protein with PIN domain